MVKICYLANNCVRCNCSDSHVQQVRSCLSNRNLPCSSSKYQILQICYLANCSNVVAVEATNDCLLLNTALVLAITNRAENLCYQFEQGQKLLPQFRKIVCLIERTVGHPRPIIVCLFGVFLYTVCAYSKTDFEPQRQGK